MQIVTKMFLGRRWMEIIDYLGITIKKRQNEILSSTYGTMQELTT